MGKISTIVLTIPFGHEDYFDILSLIPVLRVVFSQLNLLLVARSIGIQTNIFPATSLRFNAYQIKQARNSHWFDAKMRSVGL